MPSRHVSYRDKVDPGEVLDIVQEVLESIDPDDEVWVAAAIHDHVRDQVVYDHALTPGFNRSPAETYRKGGNCVDLAILLCSMFKAVGFRCRLIALEGDGTDHMTAAVAFPNSPRMVTDGLTGYYSEQGRLRERTYTWFEDEYFISDHGSRYIGDIEPLREYTTNRGQFVIRESVKIVD